MNIGQLATKALLAGKSAQETLDMVKRVFPSGNTTMKGIYYYASKAKVGLGNKSKADPKELLKALAILEGNEPVKKVRAKRVKKVVVVETPEVIEIAA